MNNSKDNGGIDMKKQIELLLVNSLAPRQRIASDTALENSLAMIRTYLEDRGIEVEVIDKVRTSNVETGVPSWCIGLLRWLVWLQLQAYQRGIQWISLVLMLISWPVQAFSLYCKRSYMSEMAEEIVNIVKEKKIPFVGIKTWYGDSFHWAILLASRLKKECPETVIIAGGPQVKVYGEMVLEQKEFDLAIMGPGEEILEQFIVLRRKVQDKAKFLIEVSHENRDFPLFRTGGFNKKKCLEEGPSYQVTIPRYRSVDMEDKILFHTLVDGVGCSWNKCNFCSHTRQLIQYQGRPVHQIIDEMRAMTQSGIAFFRFSSSETPLEYGRKIAEAILENGLQVNYSMFIRATTVTSKTYEDLSILIKSGLRAVFMGGETGHDLINALVMNKGVCKKEIIDTIQCIKLASDHCGEPCRIGLSLIYPCPVVAGVTLEDVFAENINMIEEAMPDTVIVNPPGVYPQTEWFTKAEQFGFKVGAQFIHHLMRYEYSIYKPAELWPKLDASLQGMESIGLLRETGKLRKAIAELGIPTDISDEYLMMTEAIGYRTTLDLLKFKKESLMDIMTGSTFYSKDIVNRINEHSRTLARMNQ